MVTFSNVLHHEKTLMEIYFMLFLERNSNTPLKACFPCIKVLMGQNCQKLPPVVTFLDIQINRPIHQFVGSLKSIKISMDRFLDPILDPL